MIDMSRPLRAIITDAGLTQKEICNRLGLNPCTLSRWVNGERKIPATAYAAIYNECEREIIRNGKKSKTGR